MQSTGRRHAAIWALAITTAFAACAVRAADAPAADVAVSPAGRAAASPDVAVARDGTVHVLWVDRGTPAPAAGGHAGHGGRSHNANVDVMIASSRDGGTTFGAPVRVNTKPGEVWSFPTARPELAIAPNGTLHVLYTANDVNAAGKPVIVPMYTRSTDGGRTWAPARRMATMPDADLGHVIHGGFAQAQTFGTLAVDANGGVHLYWIDTRFVKEANDTGSLLAVHSTDDGLTFGPEQVLAKSGACPCCQLTATPGAGRTMFLGMRHVEDGNRDSTVLRSDDGGRAFPVSTRLGDMRWKIEGCPLKPTVVAVQGERVYAAAFNGATEKTGVRFAASADGGRTFGPFELLHADAAVSDAPALVALRGSEVRAFWHGKAADAPARAIYTSYSSDGGRTFGPVERIGVAAQAGYPTAALLNGGAAGLAYVGDDRVWFRAVPSPGGARP
jgi:hypothetical protein